MIAHEMTACPTNTTLWGGGVNGVLRLVCLKRVGVSSEGYSLKRVIDTLVSPQKGGWQPLAASKSFGGLYVY